MTEFVLVSAIEFLLITYFWVTIIGPRGFRNSSLLRQNRNLRWCLYARRWITPSVFLVNTLLAAHLHFYAGESESFLILNAAVVLSSLVIGVVVSEVVVLWLRNMDMEKV